MSLSGTETDIGLDHRIIKALGHPLRQRILRFLNERVASPSELADELDEPLTNVSYHVKTLLENDAIELVRTAPARGAVEHFYRAIARPWFDDEHWAALPASTRRALFDQTLQQIWEHLVAAAREAGFEDLRTHITWTTLELDERAYQELTDHLGATVEFAMRLHAEASGRLAELPEAERETHRTELAMLHYHRALAGSGSSVRSAPGRKRAQAKKA